LQEEEALVAVHSVGLLEAKVWVVLGEVLLIGLLEELVTLKRTQHHFLLVNSKVRLAVKSVLRLAFVNSFLSFDLRQLVLHPLKLLAEVVDIVVERLVLVIRFLELLSHFFLKGAYHPDIQYDLLGSQVLPIETSSSVVSLNKVSHFYKCDVLVGVRENLDREDCAVLGECFL